MKTDLTKIYEKYKGLWVVLDEKLKRVVAFDKDARKAYAKALEQGLRKPTLFKVPKENLPYFGPLSS